MELEVTLPASRKSLRVRGMKVKEIDVLANKKAIVHGTAINDILNACIIQEDEGDKVVVDKMLSGDKNVLFIGVRRATYGDEYEAHITCPVCGHRALYAFDLSKLPLIEGNQELVQLSLQDPAVLHKFKFPDCGKTAYWKFKDSSDEGKALKDAKNKSDKLATTNLLNLIKRVDGLKDEGVPLKVWIQDLSAEDAEAFIDYYNECEPGLDDSLEIICDNGLCCQEIETKLPIESANFFKRSSRSKRK